MTGKVALRYSKTWSLKVRTVGKAVRFQRLPAKARLAREQNKSLCRHNKLVSYKLFMTIGAASLAFP